MKQLKHTLFVVSLMSLSMLILFSCSSHKKIADFNPGHANTALKREFRGAWMQVVNGQYQGMTPAQQQEKLLSQLDALQQVGVNAVFFQVRAEADALYPSDLEPWSRYLTGRQGVAPEPDWDPLRFMIDACHARGMELHAWINPFRAKMKGLSTSELSYRHPYMLHPEHFVEYDGLLLFNPALQVNRDYICHVVSDIVRRYDIDGVHIDDYFYPYPASGLEFRDDASFKADSRGFVSKADWRRDNVNLFVEQLFHTIRRVKPWVKFGVSPFGIYHNGTTSYVNGIPGSATRGLQNYDDLYADVLYWVRKGWVDYVVPQLYWEMGHSSADYTTLVEWWARNVGDRPLYIGQDLERSLRSADLRNPQTNQLASKFALQRGWNTIDGYCWWYGDAVRTALGSSIGKASLAGVAYRSPALQPLYPWIDDKAPAPVRKPAVITTSDGPVLCWTTSSFVGEADRPVRYIVYRFDRNEKVYLDDPAHIVGTTAGTFFPLHRETGTNRYTYVITALDRLQNESKGMKVNVKL